MARAAAMCLVLGWACLGARVRLLESHGESEGHVSHDAWMHSMALFEEAASLRTAADRKEKEARDLLSSHGDQRKCDEQMKAFDEHVKQFCKDIQPALGNGSLSKLTHVKDVDPIQMAEAVTQAMKWGHRDQSHGTLFTRPAFLEKNSSLLLWSGVSPELRGAWCKSLNLYMLHADGEDDNIRTPFGSIMEMGGVKNKDGNILGDCGWHQQAPIWQTASDAVVWQNGDKLVRLLINKPLVRRHQNWILQDSIFFTSELPTLARYPPQQGLRAINEHATVRCRHIMLFIRDRIEEFGLLEDWQNVSTFSCVDAVKVKKLKENLLYIDQTAVEFMRPGKKASSECDISQVISDEDYSKCADEGSLDFGFMRRLAQQMPPRTLTCQDLRMPQIGVFKSGENFHLLEDLAKMFDTSIVEELFLAATCKETADTAFGLKAKTTLLESPQLVTLMSDVNVKGKDDKTPLIWAAVNGHTELAKELIDAKADVNVKDKKHGRAPLIWAAVNGHKEVAKELIGAKADVNVEDKDGRAPLILAVKKGHVEVAKELIGAKADVNVEDKDGRAPLFWAVLKGHVKVAKELIDAKADVNVEDKDGRAPLIWAAVNGHTELAKELIDAKADVNVTDRFGRTPVSWAAEKGYTEIANMIRARVRMLKH